MGTFKKLLGAAAIVGAALGGATLLKNRKEQRYTEDDVFEDFDDEKVFDIKTNSDKNGNQKVTISFNSNKAKSMVNNATDKVLDASDIAVDKIKDTVGEEKYEAAKEKVNSATSFVKEKATTVKDVAIEKIGEDRIDDAKDLLSEAVDLAKEKSHEVIDKIMNVNEDSDIYDVEYSDLDDDISNEDNFEDAATDVSDEIFEDKIIEDIPDEDIPDDISNDIDSPSESKEDLDDETPIDSPLDTDDIFDEDDELDEIEDEVLEEVLDDEIDTKPEQPEVKTYGSYDFLKSPTNSSDNATSDISKKDDDFLDDELNDI